MGCSPGPSLGTTARAAQDHTVETRGCGCGALTGGNRTAVLKVLTEKGRREGEHPLKEAKNQREVSFVVCLG